MKKNRIHDAQFSDEQLIDNIRLGDENSLSLLVARYEKLVAHLAGAYKRSGGEQEDLIQEGMLGLVRALNSYLPLKAASFNTYASVCIKNALVSAVRHHYAGDRRLNVLYMEDIGELKSAEDVEQALADTENSNGYLEEIFSLLSSFESDVLKLYLSGLNRNEIAEKLDKSYKSVDNALARIKSKARNPSTRR